MSSRHNLQNCIDTARQKNGKCLSTVYLNCKVKMTWQCEKEHKWDSTWDVIKRGHWCPTCAGEKRGFEKRNCIEDCRKLAESRGGKFLSEKYINALSKYKWECNEGHIWEANYNNAQSKGRWCPYCSGNKPKTIEDCYKLAKKNNGKCLSTTYKNNSTSLKWQCCSNHIWKARYNNILRGRWCPVCAPERRKNTFIEKYGVEHNMQDCNVALKSAKSQKTCFILQHWKTNEELICVGSYEKRTVEYLNKNRVEFEWQPKVFITSLKTKTGLWKTYRPDLYLSDKDKWIEIKGYFREDSKKKWEWFHKKYSNSELWNQKKLKEMRIL